MSDAQEKLPPIPPAYFLTFRTYGTWLPGDERGTVDDSHNVPDSPRIPAIPARVRASAGRMKGPPVVLTPAQRAVVERTIAEVCQHCGWPLHRLAVRTNHVHVVVSVDGPPEPAMNRLKSWATRRLAEAGLIASGAAVWARHGRTAYLWDRVQLQGACEYVRDWQELSRQR